MSSLYNRLSNSKVKYDEKKIRRSLLIIKFAKTEPLLEKHRLVVFESLHIITIKNVKNFFKLIANVEEHRRIHEKDDVINECYFILNKCIDGFKLDSGNAFFFYYNKSLSQGLYRLAIRNYKRDIHLKEYNEHFGPEHDEHRGPIEASTNAIDPMVWNIPFTRDQKRYLRSKLQDERACDFIERTGISKKIYHQLKQEVRDLLAPYYAEAGRN